MKKLKSPSFQFYVESFLQGTKLFSNAEVGAYIRLLCEQWDSGFISADKTELTTLLHGDSNGLSARVLRKFSGKNDKLKNKRLEFERKKTQNYLKKQSENGKKGAKSKHSKPNAGVGLDGGAKAMPQPDSSSLSLSLSIEKLAGSSREKVIEFLRQATTQNITDQQLEREADDLIEKYGTKIQNLRVLCNTWAENIIPDKKKKMVL